MRVWIKNKFSGREIYDGLALQESTKALNEKHFKTCQLFVLLLINVNCLREKKKIIRK